MPLAEGEVIAGYTVVRSLGAGGMGEVYLVQHPRLPRRDALKVLGEAVCSDDEYRERFHREADIAGGLSHPHIVMVHDRGDVDGRLWISMDYVEGADAGRLLERDYPNGMPPDLVVRLVTAVAEALDYAHSRGLTHRDVKPANVLIANPGADNERIMLADFGIARRSDDTSNLTGTNMTVGTVSYAAPEQLTGEGVDGRADQYALAASAYQLLTGAPPFQHSNPAVVISAHLTAVPPPIGTKRPELDSMGPAFDKALAKTPDERFTRCVDFARALAHNVDAVGSAPGSDAHATVAARAAAAPESGPRHARPAGPSRAGRGPWLRVGVIAAILALVVAVVLLSVDDERERRAQDVPKPSTNVPVVVVGADCATLGGAGVTESGDPAYCARMPSANRDLWSLREGDIPAPTMAAAAGDPVYAPATETPVLVCMEQTGADRLECHDDIRAENTDPAANDTLTPTPTP
ncbi:serine/threonine-protein kinase [Mycolicibacterium arenosum]|uniref:non-specific serine/threonine protein kinase n=1 Tax=Mycolicibacterium arenosum TaxID=2952157 RepID=A0ABT1MBQ7_9MYCO|nr:serine/threonine-protein kinase [Mycolicibacterium sp. CAU 1645]MCP9275822.1 serine/threonine protein kinase [Mycolicibacterium sp. CAU 1645]